MNWSDELGMYARFTTALYPFLRRRMTLAEASEILQQRLRDRETNFLHVVERSVYQHPASPYRQLLVAAGCEFGDLTALVKKCGLEDALLSLRRAGVYIQFEEFKGRAPIVRNGVQLEASPHHFDNPNLVKHFYVESGGSTGSAMRVPHDLEQNAALSPNTMIGRAAFDTLDAPTALWRGILPDGSGLNNILYPAYYGEIPEKWFSHVKPFDSKNLKYTLASFYFVALGRLYGANIPIPEYLPPEGAHVVAEWARDAVRRRGKCVVTTTVSRALRVSLAAHEAEINLTGTWFAIGSEPITADKVNGIRQSGAECIPQYAMSEAGRLGCGCANPRDVTDVHFQKDAFALIPFAHYMDAFDTDITTFHLTTLLPSASRIMLNVEMDDYGILEERSCGCLWDHLGFTTHLRHIRSYRKLTGEGVTLVGSDMIHILEHVLPERFGGTALDYQLLEEQDQKGFTRLALIIAPHIAIPEERLVVETVWEALRTRHASADAARAAWANSNTLQVRRMSPLLGARGKFSSLHVQRHVPQVPQR